MKFQAPGKVVFWGEYAVLANAPAAIMAINRHATVELTPTDQGWRFSSTGFLTPGVQKHSAHFTASACARMAELALQHLGYEQLPSSFQLHSDSSGFYSSTPQQVRKKLGLGSSAAVCNATYAALCHFLGHQASLNDALAIHRRFQGEKGSGLDIASSWFGGFIAYQLKTPEASQQLAWPKDLYWRIIWTGQSADTGVSVTHFETWHKQQRRAALDDLCQASESLKQAISIGHLERYIECLRALDDQARLNIFTQDHERLATIAGTQGLVYKPCGAGGGDIGLAIGRNPRALDAFEEVAAAEGYLPLDLETAQDGVKAC